MPPSRSERPVSSRVEEDRVARSGHSWRDWLRAAGGTVWVDVGGVLVDRIRADGSTLRFSQIVFSGRLRYRLPLSGRCRKRRGRITHDILRGIILCVNTLYDIKKLDKSSGTMLYRASKIEIMP